MDVVIRRKKSNMVGALVFLVVFGIGIYFLLDLLGRYLPDFVKLKVVVTIAIGATLAFGIVVLVRRLIKKAPDIVISDEGLTDNSGPFSVGFIPWSDVKLLEGRLNELKLKMLVVHLNNPEAYLRKSHLRKGGSVYYLKQFGTPVVIAVSGLSVSHEELVRLIKEKLDAYRRANPV